MDIEIHLYNKTERENYFRINIFRVYDNKANCLLSQIFAKISLLEK